MADQPKQPYYSPLRYPGGKAALEDFLSKVLTANNIKGGIYAEAFAGGAGAALALLLTGKVSRIILNDKDPFVYKFWYSVLHYKDELIRLIQDTPVTLEEYKKRKAIFRNKDCHEIYSVVEIGFTAFFLNRCNRSGILHAGPIGGIEQKGDWKLHVRYNKTELIRRINRIYDFRKKIKIYNLDARKFIQTIKLLRIDQTKLLLYLDPPYVVQGFQLYKHFFQERDHKLLASFLKRQKSFRWLLSYDDDPLVVKLYRKSSQNCLWFNYFVNTQKIGKELVISNEMCRIPEAYQQYSKSRQLNQIPIPFAATGQ